MKEEIKIELECLTSWCNHNWTVNYEVRLFDKHGEITVRKPTWRKDDKKQIKEPVYRIVKCPLCGSKNINIKDRKISELPTHAKRR